MLTFCLLATWLTEGFPGSATRSGYDNRLGEVLNWHVGRLPRRKHDLKGVTMAHHSLEAKLSVRTRPRLGEMDMAPLQDFASEVLWPKGTTCDRALQ